MGIIVAILLALLGLLNLAIALYSELTGPRSTGKLGLMRRTAIVHTPIRRPKRHLGTFIAKD